MADLLMLKVLIGSPSDLPIERDAAEQAVNDWNRVNAEEMEVFLLPKRWELDAVPESGDRPQEILNRQLVHSSDILIAMFWTKLGTSTGKAESGTIEEINHFVDAKKPVMVYFSERPIDPSKLDTAELERLKQFKAEAYKKGIAGKFNSPENLRTQLVTHLTYHVRQIRSAMATKKEQDQRRQALGNRENTANEAAQERAEFEAKLIENKYRFFRANRGIIAVTIIPKNGPPKILKLGEEFLHSYRSRFIPLGTRTGDYVPTPHSLIVRYHDAEPLESYSLTELTIDGRLFACQNLNPSNYHDGVSQPIEFPIYLHEPELVRAIQRYLKLLHDLSVVGPWWVGLSLLKIKDFQLLPRRSALPRMLKPPCQEEHIEADMMSVDANAPFDDPKAIAELFRHQLDQMWRGFSYVKDLHFNDGDHYTLDLS